MNEVDATSRESVTETGTPPSLLTIILDTNPHAWNLLSDTLPLPKLVANLLVFINAHLAINNTNQVAVIASHTQRAVFLYPTPTPPTSDHDANTAANGTNTNTADITMYDAPLPAIDSANKYRPFALIEAALTTNLRALITSTPPSALASTPNTKLSGALTLALTHIAKRALAIPSSTSTDTNNPAQASANPSDTPQTSLQSRILIVSVSAGLSTQYIPIMNALFACQRLNIPIDVLALPPPALPSSSAEFLQQAADATAGLYTALVTPAQKAGILQTLMLAYLGDGTARHALLSPAGGGGGGSGSGGSDAASEEPAVDFRAACFCHGRVVDLGWVCSICLSIFCSPESLGADAAGAIVCATCGSGLEGGNWGLRPQVVPRARRKKKRLGGGGASVVGTPAGGSAEGTPVPGR